MEKILGGGDLSGGYGGGRMHYKRCGSWVEERRWWRNDTCGEKIEAAKQHKYG